MYNQPSQLLNILLVYVSSWDRSLWALMPSNLDKVESATTDFRYFSVINGIQIVGVLKGALPSRN